MKRIDLETDAYKSGPTNYWDNRESPRFYTVHLIILGAVILGGLWAHGWLLDWRLWALLVPAMWFGAALLARFPSYFLGKID